MGNEKRNKPDFKKWDTGSKDKEETSEDKFLKLYDDFKNSVIKTGILRELRDREYYMKPGEKRRKKIAESKMKSKQNQKRRKQGK